MPEPGRYIMVDVPTPATDPWGMREPWRRWIAAPARGWARTLDAVVRLASPWALGAWFAWN